MWYRLKSWLQLKLVSLGLPICHGVHGPCLRKGKRRRQNTNYCDDDRNWIVACDNCFEAIEEHWTEMWREHYGSRL